MDLIDAAKAAGIRGTQIAGSLGVGQATVSRWLHREVAVPSRFIRDFARLLQIGVEQVLPLPQQESTNGTQSTTEEESRPQAERG